MRLARTALALSAVGALLAGAVPLQAAAEPTNLGLNRPVTASGTEATFAAERAFDGDPGPADPTPPAVHNEPSASRWSANAVNDAWIAVDLGASADVDRIRIRWGNQHATNYTLLGSRDGVTWTPLASNLAGAKGTWVETVVSATDVRHVKMQAHARTSEWPIAIWEIEVLGTMNDTPVEQAKVGVVPLPVSALTGQGAGFTLDADTNIVADDLPAAQRLAETLRASTGLPLPLSDSGEGEIEFILDETAEVPGVEREGYLLSSTEDGVSITAQNEAGLGYGAETLLQLLGPWSRADRPVEQDWTVPALEIADGPRYEWRGYMLDPSRSFVPVDEVLSILDQMATYKLNVLHVHLSDDQGWRIAISNEGRVEGDTIDYSLLTSVSGQTAVTQSNWTDIPGRTGFYTADDFAEIVAYAADRNIAVVPEIDGPAHAQAILHAIPEANSAGSVPKPLAGNDTAPNNPTTSVGESTLDANNPATYTILRHVFNQLFEATPSELNGVRYMHIGGDESHSTTNADYRTYMGTLADFAQATDSTMMVWNEAAGSAGAQLPEGSVIQYWNGNIATTRNWAEANNGRVLMSPATQTYLPQVPAAGLGGPYWACGAAGCNLETYYNWDPTTMLGSTEDRVLGVEAPLWAEHTRSLNSIEFNMYPRLMATAEVGWTPQARRNLADFRGRLQGVVTTLTEGGNNFHPGDGTWRNDVVALQATPSTPDGVGEIAWLASPTASLADVSATLDIDGTAYDVGVTVDRSYASGIGSGTVDGRQASGLFRFSPTGSMPEGSHTGVLSIKVGAATTSVDIPLVVDGTGPALEPVADVNAVVGDFVEVAIVASDAVSFSAAGLPEGLSIDEQTGAIAGIPAAAGSSTVTVTAVDALGNASSVEFHIVVAAKPKPTPTPTPKPTPTPTSTPKPTPTPTPSPGFTPSAPYTVPGIHQINGRSWNTTCGPYSQTTRCRTDIWATVVVMGDSGYEVQRGWAFNNLTYLPYLNRSEWAANPLGRPGTWTSTEGRRWMTECDTAATGRGACRSYLLTSVVAATALPGGGHRFIRSQQWVFNNIVMFKN